MVAHNYYDWEGQACRISMTPEGAAKAEIYKPGVGFVGGPALTIQFQARPIAKSEFDAMVLAIVRANQSTH